MPRCDIKGGEHMYCVYEHINKINNKRYIGITSQEPEDRWGNNGINYKSSPHFYAAIQKYGWNNFYHNIIFSGLTKEQACRIEKELIAKYHTQNNEFGYNILEGGQATILPPEVKEKMSKAMMGNQNGKGHPCSEDKKRKISQAQKGRKLSEEHKKKLSKAAHKRHTPCSDKTRKKLSQKYPNKKPVLCLENNTVYESVQDCAKQLNLYATNVSKVCKGIHHTTGGYHLVYYNTL